MCFFLCHTRKKLSELFGVSTDYLIDPDTDLPLEVIIEDKTAQEQLRLISQLDEDDKQFVFQMIDKILTNKSSIRSFRRISVNKIAPHCCEALLFLLSNSFYFLPNLFSPAYSKWRELFVFKIFRIFEALVVIQLRG